MAWAKAPWRLLLDQRGQPLKPAAPRIVSGIKRHKLAAAVTLATLTVAAVAFFFYHNRTPTLTERDFILLADFENKTGEEVFDGTLKLGLAAQLQQTPFFTLFPDTRECGRRCN